MLRILVVDDEKAQRESLCRGIHLLGHLCVSAPDSDDALRRLGEDGPCPFDLLLTDLTMPGCTGLQLIEAAREQRPGLRVLLITGSLSGRSARLARTKDVPVLLKPFDLDQLEAAIGQAFLTRER